MIDLIIPSFFETLYMVFTSGVFAVIIGFPFGVVLTLTEKNGLAENLFINKLINIVINILRSIPFIILVIILFPLSKLIVGTRIGTTASIVPLVVSAAPFVARITESSIKEVDRGVIELGVSMGASNFEIIRKILIPEALPAIISGVTLTLVNLIGYSAMVGAIGGGGLGDLALQYGHYRPNPKILFTSVLIIVLLVQLVQFLGDKLTKRFDKR